MLQLCRRNIVVICQRLPETETIVGPLTKYLLCVDCVVWTLGVKSDSVSSRAVPKKAQCCGVFTSTKHQTREAALLLPQGLWRGTSHAACPCFARSALTQQMIEGSPCADLAHPLGVGSRDNTFGVSSVASSLLRFTLLGFFDGVSQMQVFYPTLLGNLDAEASISYVAPCTYMVCDASIFRRRSGVRSLRSTFTVV